MTKTRSGLLGVAAALLSVTLAGTLSADDARPALGVRFVQGRTVTVIDVVPGSPADRAGLRVGDVIRGLDGSRVSSTDAFIQAIAALPVTEAAELRVERGGLVETISINLTEWDTVFESPETSLREGDRARRLSYVSLLDDAVAADPDYAVEDAHATDGPCCTSAYYVGYGYYYPAYWAYPYATYYYPAYAGWYPGCCSCGFAAWMYPPTYTSAYYAAPGYVSSPYFVPAYVW